MVVNIKKITAKLGNSDLTNLINKLNSLKKGLDEADKKIVKDMAEYIEQQTSNNLASTAYKDGNEDAQAYSEIKDKTAIAGMKGSQVLYDEFGTGTEGANSPHPDKGKFKLNAYNSGKNIVSDVDGNLYWTYLDKSTNQFVKTQGIPAGKQVYDANESLRKKKKEIIKNRVGEVISKL